MNKKTTYTIMLLSLFAFPKADFAQGVADFQSAAGFALFSSTSAVTNSGTSAITGNIGYNASGSGGFGNFNGVLHNNDGVFQQAKSDAETAAAQIGSAGCSNALTQALGSGQKLTPKTYCIEGAATLTGNLILDGQGNPNAVFIIRINGSLTTSSGATVSLVNGTTACHVFWKTEGAFTAGTGTDFKGNVISNGAITLNSGTRLEGRAFSTGSTVTVSSAETMIPLGCGTPVLRGPRAPDYGFGICYSVFTSVGSVTNTGPSIVVGDIGTNNGSVTGFNTLLVEGGIHSPPDSSTAHVALDLVPAYNFLNSLVYDIDLPFPAQLGSNIRLTPHTYRLNGNTTLTDTMILDGLGNPDAKFVVLVNGDFTASAGSMVMLAGSARACNIFWKVEGNITVSANAILKGTLLSHSGAINLGNGSSITGRVFNMNGAVNPFAASVYIPAGYSPCGAPTINTAPVAVNDTIRTFKNTSVVIDVLANDYDPNGDPLTADVVTTPRHGTVSPVNKQFAYYPTSGFVGRDSFQYVIHDDGNPALGDSAWVFITVGPNRPPKAVNDTIMATKNAVRNIEVLHNDYDPDGDPLNVSILIQPRNGSATIDSGRVVYIPNNNFIGKDSLFYRICDNGTPVYCDSAWVFITVVNNRGPVAVNDTVSTFKNSSIVIDETANDYDPDGDSLTVTIITNPRHGIATFTGKNIRYVPIANFIGTDSIRYRICDNGTPSLCDDAWIFISTINGRPVAVNDTANTIRNFPVTVNVTANDYDPDGGPLSVSITSNPQHGFAALVGNNIRYTPNTGYLGTDSFTYRICDNGTPSLCDTAWVFINVTSPKGNRPPVAINDAASMCNNGDSIIIMLLTNDSDPDQDQINAGILAGPVHGTATITGNQMTYKPNAGFSGNDSVFYIICDNGFPSLCAYATVVVTVKAAPSPIPGTNYTICKGSGILIGKQAIAGNDYLWTPSTGLSSPVIAQPVASPSVTTSYTFTETVRLTGCSATSNVIVLVNPQPDAVTGPSHTIYRGASVVLGTTAVANNRYRWTPATGLNFSNTSNPTASPDVTTTYTLTETDTLSGCTKTNSVTITVAPIEFYNAFSPNGDGINDFWKIPILDIYPVNTVTIINRWGSVVWNTSNYNNTSNYFSGRNLNGNDLPDGAYYYIIQYNSLEKRGWVLIKR